MVCFHRKLNVRGGPDDRRSVEIDDQSIGGRASAQPLNVNDGEERAFAAVVAGNINRIRLKIRS